MATFRIRVDATHWVSALLMEPRDAKACWCWPTVPAPA